MFSYSSFKHTGGYGMKRFSKIVQLFLLQTHWAIRNEEVCLDCSVIPPSNTLGGMEWRGLPRLFIYSHPPK